jgi:hypothetical protein
MPLAARQKLPRKLWIRAPDYLLAVKDNEGTLADTLRDFFAEGKSSVFGKLPINRYETVEKNHGRIETRRALWVTDLSWLDQSIQQRRPKLAGVGLIERQREINGKVSHEGAFYIGSKGVASAESRRDSRQGNQCPD